MRGGPFKNLCEGNYQPPTNKMQTGLPILTTWPVGARGLGFQRLAPGSCQGQALGPRFRGGDGLGGIADLITGSFAGTTG